MLKTSIVLIFFMLISGQLIWAQSIDSLAMDTGKDSLNIENETIEDFIERNNLTVIDTVKPIKKEKSTEITETVNYEAADSIVFSFKENLIYMYKKSKVEYTDITLQAGHSMVDLKKNTIKATYLIDTTSTKKKEKPQFAQGEEKFSADTITYNFKSKKGIIKGIFTEQEGGYLHAETTKKQPDNTIHISKGEYTTCDYEHAHYSFKMKKAIVEEDKIISGPVYFTVAGIPTPLALPFGYFPKQKKHHSGILMPTYGEEQTRGFFLKNGGYYFSLNDYWDLALVGDIFANGSWAVRSKSQYMKKYKFSGDFELAYSNDKQGEKEINYSNSTSYWIKWSHRQDSKANPTSNFSASVNFGSSNYNTYNTQSMNDYLSSSFRSSISYSKRWPASPFNFNANLSHSQNTQTKAVSVTLPDMSFSMARIFPFERKKAEGKQRWYEKISLSYNSSARLTANAPDSVMFTPAMPIDAGFKHSAPLSASYKFLKFFTFNPSVDYEGVLYPNYTQQSKVLGLNSNGDTIYTLQTDTINSFKYAHSFGSSVSLTFSAPVYGIYQTTKKAGKVQALRHIITPSASISYTPDMGFVTDQYYKTYYNPETDSEVEYTIFSKNMYGTPNSRRESGNISMSLSNTLEMKLLNPKDTVENTKKVKLIDRFNISTAYNILADSMKWSPVSMNASTKLFNQVNINTSARFDVYDVDSLGKSINQFVFEENKGQLLQFKSFSFSTGYAFDSKSFGKNKDTKENSNERSGDYFGEVYYADFSVPWNLRFDYSLNVNMNFNRDTLVQDFEPEFNQTLRISGGFSLTPLWKVSFTSGYDFKYKKVTYTTMSLHRDLHCWEMSVNAVPFGSQKRYFFQLNIKSSMLQDLKLKKEKNHLDNF